MSAASLIFKTALKAYKTDRRNRYSLLEPWELPLIDRLLPYYWGRFIRIEPQGTTGKTRITVMPYHGDVCDGASLAPDKPKGVIPAALFHDPWYMEIPEIAEAWDWPQAKVRRLGDEIFSTIMQRAEGSKLVVRIYYNAIWHFGGLYRAAKKVFVVVAFCAVFASLAGCGGCLSPPDISDPDSPYTDPVWEQTQ